MVGGTGQFPSLQAPCVGGGSIVNSAIMYELPAWVRREWARETGIDLFTSNVLDRAYQRVFRRLRVAPTPLAVMGRRNLLVRDALTQAGIENGPSPRARERETRGQDPPADRAVFVSENMPPVAPT
jgi:hypothetical protein